MRSYDVIVAGAGPAGLSAAGELSRLGVSALLLEGGRWATPKQKSWSTFQSTLKEFKLLSCRQYRMDEIRVYMNNTACLHFAVQKDPFWSLHEKRLLTVLLQRVSIDKKQRTLVQKIERRNNRVYVYTSRGVFVTKIFIDASGNGSIVRNHFHLPMDTYSFLHCQMRTNCAFTSHKIAWAYGGKKKAKEPFFVGWMAPYSRNTVLTATFRVSAKDARIDEHRRVIQNMLRDAYYASAFASSKVVHDFNARIPITPLKQIVFDNMLVVGDAAGFTPPLTQEGLRPGLELGRLAAKAAHHAIKTKRYSSENLSYFITETRLRKKNFFENLDLNKLLQLLLFYLNDEEIVSTAKLVDKLPNKVKLDLLRSELTIADIERVFFILFAVVPLRKFIRRVSKKDRETILTYAERYAIDVFEDELEHLVHKL